MSGNLRRQPLRGVAEISIRGRGWWIHGNWEKKVSGGQVIATASSLIMHVEQKVATLKVSWEEGGVIAIKAVYGI